MHTFQVIKDPETRWLIFVWCDLRWVQVAGSFTFKWPPFTALCPGFAWAWGQCKGRCCGHLCLMRHFGCAGCGDEAKRTTKRTEQGQGQGQSPRGRASTGSGNARHACEVGEVLTWTTEIENIMPCNWLRCIFSESSVSPSDPEQTFFLAVISGENVWHSLTCLLNWAPTFPSWPRVSTHWSIHLTLPSGEATNPK